jgi:hypothetical protein
MIAASIEVVLPNNIVTLRNVVLETMEPFVNDLVGVELGPARAVQELPLGLFWPAAPFIPFANHAGSGRCHSEIARTCSTIDS